MLGHIRSQRMAKLQIFTCWSLFAPIVGAIRGEDAVRSRFWSSDGPPFCHLRHGGLKRYDSLWLTGVSHTPTCWDVGSTHLQAVLGLSLRKPRLCRRPTWRTTPPRGGTRSSAHQRDSLHRLRDARRLQRRGTYASFRANSLLKPCCK